MNGEYSAGMLRQINEARGVNKMHVLGVTHIMVSCAGCGRIGWQSLLTYGSARLCFLCQVSAFFGAKRRYLR